MKPHNKPTFEIRYTKFWELWGIGKCKFIEADYQLSVSQAFSSFARVFIISTGRLEILWKALFEAPNGQVLPSWVRI
jgi:hypothetical protein